jgi:putative RNA 2'-phosphotransferase
MGRHHVHLSPDAATARRVGARHGPPVVLEVAAGRLAAAGHVFLRSDNGVWLTAHVPPDALRLA